MSTTTITTLYSPAGLGLEGRPTGGIPVYASELSKTRVSSDQPTTLAHFAEETGVLRSEVSNLKARVDTVHGDALGGQLNERARRLNKRAAVELLDSLYDSGFAWRDIARMIGVSVPAVQKWRRGEAVSPANRYQLSLVVATVELAAELYMVVETASWFEIPVAPGVAPVTPIDIAAGCRFDLVLDYASGHTNASDLLDQFDADWRERYRSDFEVFTASDGILAIRPRVAR